MPIVAVSSRLFDSWPGYNGWNPNTNPICNKHIKATYGNTSVIVQVTDRCEGCAERDLDLSPSAFMQLAPLSYGRLEEAQRWIGNGMIDLHGITWEWVAGTGRLTELPCNDNAC
jgi:hypothetical protein